MPAHKSPLDNSFSESWVCAPAAGWRRLRTWYEYQAERAAKHLRIVALVTPVDNAFALRCSGRLRT